MATASAPTAAEVIRPLRRAEYDQLIALGAFEDEKIELLDGELVAMSPIGTAHNSVVQRLNELLVLALHGRAWVRCQLSFAASDLSETEPDFIVAERREYDHDHPSQAHLIIEVAESSLVKDRGRKLRLYATCQVPEYWIVNLVDRCIEVYRDVDGPTYARMDRFERGQSIQLLAFGDVTIAVSDVLK
jgi:Uma2 family endonuclease